MAQHQQPTSKLLTNEGNEKFVVFKTGFYPLSMYYPSVFKVEGKKYYTGNHYVQAKKAEYFGDVEAADEIRKNPSPREADQIADSINGFDDEKWASVRDDVILEACRAKFKGCFGPRRCLKGTGDAIIVFANTRDRVLGNGVDYESDWINAQRSLWEGENKLGKILQVVRQDLQ